MKSPPPCSCTAHGRPACETSSLFRSEAVTSLGSRRQRGKEQLPPATAARARLLFDPFLMYTNGCYSSDYRQKSSSLHIGPRVCTASSALPHRPALEELPRYAAWQGLRVASPLSPAAHAAYDQTVRHSRNARLTGCEEKSSGLLSPATSEEDNSFGAAYPSSTATHAHCPVCSEDSTPAQFFSRGGRQQYQRARDGWPGERGPPPWI